MKLILAYKRRKELVNDTHLFDGYLQEDRVRIPLNGKTFAELIFQLSERLRGLVLNPHDEVAMIRLEQPTVVHPISDVEVDMIRNHPHKYIEALSPPPRRIVLNIRDKVPTAMAVVTQISAGIETLADAFGDAVYLLMKRGGAVECPCCGRWGQASHGARDDKGKLIQPKDHGLFTCNKCDAKLIGKSFPTSVGGWWVVGTEVLLTDGKRDRYFLPRLWNISGPWITYEDLQAKYDKYIEEKENADN